MDAVNKNETLPDPTKFTPPLSENVLGHNVSLAYNPDRKTLFNGKMFIFPTNKLWKQMETSVSIAGGESLSWEITTLSKSDFDASPSKYIVMQGVDMSIVPKNKDSLEDFIKYYQSKGKRIIPLHEIAMAVVKISCEKDCNPDFDRTGTLVTDESQKFANKTLVPETQSMTFTARPSTQAIIPETMDIDPFPLKPLACSSQIEVTEKEKRIVGNKREGDELLGMTPKKAKGDSQKEVLFQRPQRLQEVARASDKKKVNPFEVSFDF